MEKSLVKNIPLEILEMLYCKKGVCVRASNGLKISCVAAVDEHAFLCTGTALHAMQFSSYCLSEEHHSEEPRESKSSLQAPTYTVYQNPQHKRLFSNGKQINFSQRISLILHRQHA